MKCELQLRLHYLIDLIRDKRLAFNSRLHSNGVQLFEHHLNKKLMQTEKTRLMRLSSDLYM